MTPTIIVHGGADDWGLTSAELQEGIEACVAAARAGQAVLLRGGSALDGVETAVHILEDCPVLEAGRGSKMNAAGEIEMDAMIMNGRDLSLGAIAAVRQVRHPISLARRVMVDTPHNFIVGAGAEAFADSIGFPRCQTADLLAPSEVEAYQTRHGQSFGDTVGAVALDAAGNLAVGTSTGGIGGKLPGRVGDSPLVGSGGYADNWTAAVSATGYGEALMKVLMSKRVCDFVGNGLSAQAACEAAIRLLEERVQGEGGVIAIDRWGQVGWAFNTTAMPYAYVVGEGEVVYGR
ncbi:MAG: isoaspartyl peptidase/L-asparaginase [Ardenticatenaceae bacterium]|nr:isoaspartyl peptidase/L-asparaginase [Ardenticatenaceae bacterium]